MKRPVAFMHCRWIDIDKDNKNDTYQQSAQLNTMTSCVVFKLHRFKLTKEWKFKVDVVGVNLCGHGKYQGGALLKREH